MYIGRDIIKINKKSDNKQNFKKELVNQINKDKHIKCISCKEVLGITKEDSVIYYTKKVSGVNKNYDIFWRNSELGEVIEKIQSEERQNIKIEREREVIEIIKVTKEPDTFIFIKNNPIITSRILFKISNINKEELNNHKKKEIVNKKEFEHIKKLLMLFSHDKDQTDWIASLLPQI